jgi:hypothetical protein
MAWCPLRHGLDKYFLYHNYQFGKAAVELRVLHCIPDVLGLNLGWYVGSPGSFLVVFVGPSRQKS